MPPPSNEITDIWEFNRKKYINIKIRNTKEDLVMQFSWYVTAVGEIMTDFLITIRWRKLFNSHCLDRVNVGKFVINSFHDELQNYGAREGLTWLWNV